LVFADWEELDGDSMDEWSEFVHLLLNDGEKRDGIVSEDILTSESGFSGAQKVHVITGTHLLEKSMRDLQIGDRILDSDGFTTIVGLAKINTSENKSCGYLNNVLMSGSTWVFDKTWKHAAECEQWQNAHPVSDMISIFTESGTLKVNKILMRDFSDIGLENIDSSYNFTLSRLNDKRSSL
jgi:hypothetical protein